MKFRLLMTVSMFVAVALVTTSVGAAYIIPPSTTGYIIPLIGPGDHVFDMPTVVSTAYANNSFVVDNPLFANPATIDFVSFGKVRGDLYVTGDSEINLIGGGIGDNVWMYHSSHAVLSSGRVGEWFIAVDEATAVWDGPASAEWIVAGGNAHIDITDGRFENLLAKMNGVIVIEGSGFDRPLGPITDTQGTITGTLASGHTFTADFERRDQGQIILVPEPAGVGMMLIAAVACLRRR